MNEGDVLIFLRKIRLDIFNIVPGPSEKLFLGIIISFIKLLRISYLQNILKHISKKLIFHLAFITKKMFLTKLLFTSTADKTIFFKEINTLKLPTVLSIY